MKECPYFMSRLAVFYECGPSQAACTGMYYIVHIVKAQSGVNSWHKSLRTVTPYLEMPLSASLSSPTLFYGRHVEPESENWNWNGDLELDRAWDLESEWVLWNVD